MLVDADLYKKIRQSRINGESQRSIAKRLGINRKTVRKYCDGGAIPGERVPRREDPADESALNPAISRKNTVKKLMATYLEETSPATGGKQKTTIKMVHEYVRKTIDISYPTICRYMPEVQEKDSEGFLALSFEPGEAMQVDYCDITVKINGEAKKCQLFCCLLAYSGMIFSMILPDQKLENLVEGHVEAFKYFNGTVKRIIYDNCKAIVYKGGGKNAIKQRSFMLLESHYGFEAVLTNIAKPNEKGLVENLCGNIRKLAYTPIPSGKNLLEINNKAMISINYYNLTHKKARKEKSIHEMYKEECNFLIKLPGIEYHKYTEIQRIVDKFSTVSYDTNRYSVPTKLINQLISLKITPYEIACWHKGELIYTHIRSLDKYADVFVLEHYLDLLAMKKRGTNNSSAAKTGIVPPEINEFRDKCKEPDKYDHVVKVMLLGKHVEAGLLLEAVREANKTANPTYQKVANHLAAMKMVRAAEFEGTFLDFDDIEPVGVTIDDLSEYDKLM
jgi:transposase